MKISWISRLTDLLFPRCCALCGQRLAVTEEHLCTPCIMDLPLTKPWALILATGTSLLLPLMVVWHVRDYRRHTRKLLFLQSDHPKITLSPNPSKFTSQIQTSHTHLPHK